MLGQVTARRNFIYDSLELYASWVNKNLERVRINARIGETLLPVDQWTQMFGLDLFCEDHKNLAAPFHLKSKNTLVGYFRETLSREVGKRDEKLKGSVFASVFPGIMSKPKAKSLRKSRARVKPVATPVSVYAAAQSADPISDVLNTSYAPDQDSLAEVFRSAKESGASSVNISVTF